MHIFLFHSNPGEVVFFFFLDVAATYIHGHRMILSYFRGHRMIYAVLPLEDIPFLVYFLWRLPDLFLQ